MIVKKLIAAIMIFTMLMTCIQPCFAATINDITDFVPNPLEMGLTVGVNARKSGTADGYGLALTLDNVYSDGTGGGVDYQATLDMAPIRNICTGAFISNIVQNNPDLKAEFDDAPVATTVKAIIEYPTSAIVGDLASAGVLSAGDIFSEVSRNIESGKVTITYKNDENVTAKDLVDNVDAHLKDITFTLDDAVTYTKAGSHIVSVTLSGSTSISFSSKTQVIEYNGQASHVTNVTMGDMENHALAVEPAVPATCLTPGKTEGIICSTCNRYDCGADGTKEPEIIVALNHKDANGDSLKIHIDGEAATCTATGIIEHWTCPLCKCDFEHIGAPGALNGVAGDVVKAHADFIIEKIAHTLDTADTHVDATCSTPGYTDGKYCSICGITIQAPTLLPATGIHSVVAIGVAKAATCTVDGITAGEKCGVCYTVLVPQVIIPATGHNFGAWSIVTPATESNAGKKERTCTNGCSTKEEVEIPKLAHTHVIDPKMDVITQAPTCTTAGKKQQYCGCGTAVGAEVAVPATGHKLSHVDAVAANCVTKGKVEHYTCVNGCGQNFRDSQAKYKLNSVNTPKDKSNHVEFIDLKGFAATCEKDGLTDGKKCKACNTVTVNMVKISRKTIPHTLVDVPLTPATCERNGAEAHKHCEVCNADFDMTGTNQIKEQDFRITALGHDYDEPYLAAPLESVGRDYYKAYKKCENTVCDVPGGKIVETRIHKTNACPHTILVGENETSTYVIETIVEPTCTEKGKGRKICSICGNIESTNIDIEPLGHTYEWVEQVNATCHKKGTAGHYRCKICDKLFDSEKREISKPRELDKITEHRYQKIDSETEQCYHCGEKMRVKKKDKDGNDAPGLGVNVEKPAHIKQADTDKEREDITKHGKDVQNVESNIIIEEREEASDKIDEKIHSKKTTEDTIVEKLVFDIVVEKVITYDSGDVDREVYKETSDFVVIKINIPAGMRNNAESFIVHRHHIAENGTESFDEIRESIDDTKERIVVASDKSYITLYVKKFSEYAVAAYSTEVEPAPEDTPSTSGGGGSASYTIKLNVNGGVVLNDVVVKRGEKIELPIPTRDGYVFAGWFTDSTFNTPFDENTAINRNYVLYAKWIEAGKCEGTVADNCPCLKYNDLNPELWYHEGVDYVLNNGMMIGTGDKTFEPDSSVTRAMLVTVLWRAEGKPVSIKDSTFDDLKAGEYYVEAVEWAAENGIVNGYSDTEFAPNDAIAREQIAAIMFRYTGFKGYDVSVGENTNILSYTDYEQISEYAIPAMQWAAGSGLMTGRTNSTLNPQADTTRAELATILYRFFATKK